MDTDELMAMAARKAIKELPWESIEFLFKPRNLGSLLLRLDFEGTCQKVNEAFASDDPDAMPHRFRSRYYPDWSVAIRLETFYLKCKLLHDLNVPDKIT